MGEFVFIMAGLFLLLAGGEVLVRGAVALARRMGLSELVVGLTLVGTLTSLPELMVSLRAATDGAPALALGNAIGSNVANLLLVLGAAAVVYPLTAARSLAMRDGLANVAAALCIAGLAGSGFIERWQGAVLLLLLVVYLANTYRLEKRAKQISVHEKEARDLAAPPLRLHWAILSSFGGLLGLIVGARLLVDGSVALARSAGLSEAVIGLTLVAVGTSFPELATSVVAAYRRHSDVAVGNALGSCMFNSLGIIGTASLVIPMPVEAGLASVDVWVMVAASAMVTLVMAWRGKIARPVGGLFLILYVVYCAWLWWQA